MDAVACRLNKSRAESIRCSEDERAISKPCNLEDDKLHGRSKTRYVQGLITPGSKLRRVSRPSRPTLPEGDYASPEAPMLVLEMPNFYVGYLLIL